MNLSRVRPADWLAGIGGLVLFVSLWLKWYGIDGGALTDGPTVAAIGTTPIPSITAWQAFSEIDVLLALFALPAIGVPVSAALSNALPAIGVPVSAALSKGPAAPVAFTVIATCASFLAVLLVLFRLLDQPGSNELVAVKYGAWIGLAGALLAFVGSWLAMADEHTPGAVPPPIPRRPAP
jgi:hypothetical protein